MFMKRFGHKKDGVIGNIISELNLSEEQSKKIEELKKEGKKDKLTLFAKMVLGRAGHQDIMKVVLDKVEKAEDILSDDQKDKIRDILIEKHKEFFMHALVHKHGDLKEMFEELELSEDQKDKIEVLIGGLEVGDCFEIKDKIDEILNYEQKEKAKLYIKSIIGLEQIFEELEIDEEQKEKLNKLHEKVSSKKREVYEKFKSGELSFSEMLKEKMQIFDSLAEILTKKQIKKIHRMHQFGHHKFGCMH